MKESRDASPIQIHAQQLDRRKSIGDQKPDAEACNGHADGSDDDSAVSSSEAEQATWAETDALSHSILQAFESVPQPQSECPCSYTKLLIVGDARLGKSTLVKNMFAAYAQDADLPVGDASGEEASATFRDQPERLQTEVVVKDDVINRMFHYTVQDTPGCDLARDIGAIVDFVQQQNEAYLALESDPGRSAPLASFPDPRVDVALYFVAPHNLRPLDVRCMVALSAVTAVVPILAKADSMTPDELADMRAEVRDALAAASKESGRPVAHAFSRTALVEAGAQRPLPPFAVICSRHADMAIGRFWFIRQYGWGCCSTLAEPHSDLPVLKRLLFETGAAQLKAATEARYFRTREAVLAAPGTRQPARSQGSVLLRVLRGPKGLALCGLAISAAAVVALATFLAARRRRSSPLLQAAADADATSPAAAESPAALHRQVAAAPCMQADMQASDSVGGGGGAADPAAAPSAAADGSWFSLQLGQRRPVSLSGLWQGRSVRSWASQTIAD